MSRFIKIASLLVAAVFAVVSCKTDGAEKNKPVAPPAEPAYQKPAVQLPVPAFLSDSAFVFIEKQLAFGPRVPNSSAHLACKKYLAGTLARLGAKVTEQPFTAKRYDGLELNCTNIIGQFRPENKRRILLTAHWDSRFMSDQDATEKTKGVPAADDGGSGVGVLLEIARVLQKNPADIGIDIIFWDGEDQGQDNGGDPNSWCLGSQHWVKNKHISSALFGINLDMVGAKGARFPKERNSMAYAPNVVNKIWGLAQQMGHAAYFSNDFGGPITDDHAVVSELGGIPCVDIINLQTGQKTFGAHWHTQGDNLSVIDKNVLQAVGQTVTAVIYRSYNGTF